MKKLPLAACLLFIPAAFTGEKAATNSLTAKEAAEGWLSLFDGETLMGWTPQREAKWTIEKGSLVGPKDRMGSLLTTSRFRDYELQFEYQSMKDSDGKAVIGFSGQDEAAPESIELKSFDPEGAWVPVKATVKGTRLASIEYAAGMMGMGGGRIVPDESERKAAVIGFSGKNLVLRNIKLKPLATHCLFNGKDLNGWNVFMPEKYKSKYSVTDKGELNVKNGPGDIQTNGKYGDFLLQLECISNGKHLNSGIFFRCKPNEYQNGYEVQIRNEFTAKPKQAYTVETFDPRTNKLVEKGKVQSPAVDYGTGTSTVACRRESKHRRTANGSLSP